MFPMDYIDRHYPVMYRYAIKLTRDAEAAHDVVVDAIFSVANRDFSTLTHWKSYLNKSVYFAHISRKRKSRNAVAPVELEPNEHSVPALQVSLTDAAELHSSLTPLMRDVYFTGKTTAEIAKERRMPEQRIKAVLQKEQTEWKKSNAFRADQD